MRGLRTHTLILVAFIGLVALLGSGCKPSLEAQLRKRIKEAHGAETVAVAFLDVKSGEQLGIDDHVSMHAASTMKLPVMMEVFRLAGVHALSLEQSIHVENKFHSLVDRSEFALDAKDDGDPWMYTQLGKDVPLYSVVERMIVRSSNLATNLLMDRVGAQNVTKLCRSLGANEIQVRRGVEDEKAYQAGLVNTTGAHDLLVLLDAIYRHRAAGADAMMAVLEKQEDVDGIPAGLPAHTPVAHKTGWLERLYHDAAIVNPKGPHPYVLVVMTRGLADKPARTLVADLSRIVNQHVLAQPVR